MKLPTWMYLIRNNMNILSKINNSILVQFQSEDFTSSNFNLLKVIMENEKNLPISLETNMKFKQFLEELFKDPDFIEGKKVIEQTLENVPNSKYIKYMGVYLIYVPEYNLIYFGKSYHLKTRFTTHILSFQEGHYNSALKNIFEIYEEKLPYEKIFEEKILRIPLLKYPIDHRNIDEIVYKKAKQTINILETALEKFCWKQNFFTVANELSTQYQMKLTKGRLIENPIYLEVFINSFIQMVRQMLGLNTEPVEIYDLTENDLINFFKYLNI